MTRSTARFSGDGDEIPIVDRTDWGQGRQDGPVAYGRTELFDALDDRGDAERVGHWTETDRDSFLVVGPTDDSVVARLLGEETESLPPESVLVQWCDAGDGDALVVAGTDDRGLMYALLEVADRVDADGLPALAAVDGTVETPDNRVRGVDRFLEGPAHDAWFYDEEFWHYYLSRLAENRFNRFVLVTGYDTAFMSPPYPFVLDVPGFPGVELSDDVGVTQAENRERLRRVGELCERYGLEFVLGVWQQRPWSANPDAEADPTDQGMLVEGLPEESDAYTDYCREGMYELLVACPEVDGVQLRVNFESGVGDRSTAEGFWRELVGGVERAAEDRGDDVRLDLRAKGLTDRMIDWGLETGLDVAVPTKFWCESTGLPYHNTRMRADELADLDDMNRSRRYSYADLLEEPRAYDVLYRLWVIGTNRLFVWGDPDYARRFGHAAGFGDSAGYEVTAPLSLKGGHHFLQSDQWPLFDDESLRHYEYEDERYWAWYLLFGRLGYSTETNSAVWEREFERRFGAAADAVEEAYRAASKVLPLHTAAHLTSHPALLNWAELDTGGALFAENNFNPKFGDTTYASAEPSDPGLFYGVDEYVRDRLGDGIDHRYTPLQVARGYEHLAAETREALDAARERVSDPGGEYEATALDLRMLADLADYHAAKTRAAVELAAYRETDDVAALEAAYGRAGEMVDHWKTLSERGEGTYRGDLVFAMGPAATDEGNWSDRLVELESDLDALRERLRAEGVAPSDIDPASGGVTVVSDADGRGTPFDPPTVEASVPEAAAAGEPVRVSVRTGGLAGVDDLTLHYRHADQTEGAFRTAEMTHRDGAFHASVPANYVTPEWDLLVYVSGKDRGGDPVLHPGIYHAEEPDPYYVIEVEE